jgi:CO/xanthine dehydrogenase FAD-binding subunit
VTTSDLPELCYACPRDLGEAAEAIARPGACIYAGGTDLLVALTERRPWARFVREIVDVKRLDAATGVQQIGERLRIGALVTAEALASNTLVRREAPVLAEAAAATAAPTLRRRATIGGNLTTPHPAGDVATALLALEATAEVLDGSAVRDVPIAAFIAAQADTWPRQQLIVAVSVPTGRRGAFEKAGSRSSFSRSVAAVGVVIDERGATVALGGMRERPFVAIAVAAAIAEGRSIGVPLAAECRPPADGFVSPAYRLRLAELLIARALARAGRR